MNAVAVVVLMRSALASAQPKKVCPDDAALYKHTSWGRPEKGGDRACKTRGFG